MLPKEVVTCRGDTGGWEGGEVKAHVWQQLAWSRRLRFSTNSQAIIFKFVARSMYSTSNRCDLVKIPQNLPGFRSVVEIQTNKTLQALMHDFNKSVAINKGSDEIMLPDFNQTR